MPATFSLLVETDAGPYQHPYHLGTVESTARRIAEEVFRSHYPRKGQFVLSVALMHDGQLYDAFDGEWGFDFLR